MKSFLLICIPFIFSCSVISTTSTLPQSVALSRSDGSTIDFYMKSNSAKTLLLYLQGSDCNSVLRDRFLQDHIEKLWPSADVLLVEKRGITADLPPYFNAERSDCPREYIQHDNPEQRVADLKKALNSVQQKYTYQNVIALGGSEGAQIAAMIAAESDLIDAAVLINAGGRYFLDDVLHNIRLTTPEDILEEEIAGFSEFAKQIVMGDFFELEVSNHGYKWWRNMLTYDMQNTLTSIRIPTLIIQAGQDKSVSAENATAMVENLKASGKSNLDFVAYPDLDHGLINTDGISKAEQVVEDIHHWLKLHIK